jgi:hypothetical protein
VKFVITPRVWRQVERVRKWWEANRDKAVQGFPEELTDPLSPPRHWVVHQKGQDHSLSCLGHEVSVIVEKRVYLMLQHLEAFIPCQL